MKGAKVIQKSNKSSIQDMQQMLGEIFHPQPNNIHIYLDKIFQLYVQYDKMSSVVLKAFDKSLFGSVYSNRPCGFPMLSKTDKTIFKETKKLKDLFEQELKQYLNGNQINGVTIQMYSQLKNNVDLTAIEQFSNYFNGSVKDTFPNQLQKHGAELFDIFKEIETIEKSQLMGYYQSKINKIQDDFLTLFDLPLADYIKDSLIDKDQTKIDVLTMTLKIFFKEQKKLYDVLKIPEFNVESLKEMIKFAIAEFKKSLPRCDLAFQKLLQSLDVFVDNFDKYYENFNSEGREPAVLFVNFIDDVQNQYANADTKECRKLLRQFKQIQVEFGKRLGQNLNNPMIKQLYEQLQGQMDKATTLLNLDEDDEEEDENEEEKEGTQQEQL